MSEHVSSETKLAGKWLGARVTPLAPVVAVYLLATLFTDAYFMADTADYVDSIAAYDRGLYYDFWEFGHLFWRPLGWLCFKLQSLFLGVPGEAETRARVVWSLLVINWLAGLVCVVCLYQLVKTVSRREWAAAVVALAFIFSHGFLNYAQAGSSYVPGLALLTLGLWLLARGGERGDDSWRTAALGGAALAASVCFWLPYLWAIPAALALPPILFGADAARKRLAWRAALVCALAVGLSYAAVLVHLGIYSVAGFREWVARASHGNESRGMARVAFGLPRSFIQMGNDGVLFKRYLLRDPFNPVTAFDLVRLSLWKIGLFYAVLLAAVVQLLRAAEGKRVLLLLLVSAAPVLGFAVMFDGGAIERYLPLYPVLFLSLGCALTGARSKQWAKVIAAALVAVVALVNVMAMAKATLNRQQEAAASRVRDLASALQPHSRIFTATWVDDLVNFNRSFPLHPLNRGGGLVVGSLVTPGTSQTGQWRQEFAARALEAWGRGGDVWVSRRVFAARPGADWSWAEGDDPHISWLDFPAFFADLEMGQTVGGEDGFVLVPPSEKNRRVLEGFARERRPAGEAARN
ncbi:MAG TPA: hypothetical protein VGC87_04265 [Pyrinomonadaceae bacterium]|jgi:hypothetical protein